MDKPTRQDKTRTPRKDVLDNKSKSPSPLTKSVQIKAKAEAEAQKAADGTKKDPRLKKRPQDKAEPRVDELKDKRRCSDKKERDEAQRGPDPLRTTKTKLHNGSVLKHERDDSAEKTDFKAGGNARTHARKRTRSRSRSHSPTASPKRKDRRSPKSRARSSSPSPSHKPGKPRRVRAEDPQHGKAGREDRLALKKNQLEGRRPKRPAEERRPESRDSHSPRGHEGAGKESKEMPQRWRSGWEENKQ